MNLWQSSLRKGTKSSFLVAPRVAEFQMLGNELLTVRVRATCEAQLT